MKALRSFTVRPSLPKALAPLEGLAMNLRWSWDLPTRELFRWVDPEEWDAVVHDPVRLLGNVSRARLEELEQDQGFLRSLEAVCADLERYVERDAWFQRRTDSPLRSVAYFSPEFGISEALPQYSGGLGILAGDHLKAASDLGLPLIGIGLMYRNGYFRQALNVEGWQEQRYPNLDPHGMALTLQDEARIQLDLGGESLFAQIWRADVGRTTLYLLDTDVDENSDTGRAVTDRLYGGDTEHRLRQEILLGIGGVRALRALGVDTQVFHTNEGHAGFLGLELIREHMADSDLDFSEAIEAVRAGSVFTTHTPVPAGIDRFPATLIEKYFTSWASAAGIGLRDLLALGHEPSDVEAQRFNMAVMGFRLGARANGVARLHGQVSREMFNPLWPDVPVDEVPIGSITNGVHARTWVSPEMDDLLTRHVHPHWGEAGPADWARIHDATDEEVWRVREQGKDRLIGLVRDKIRSSAVARGQAPGDVAWADEVFDARALTIGFARRFATYKRATLLLSQPERLRALLTSIDRPVQFVFAGKAHPADDHGKEMIRQIVAFSSDPKVRHRFVFIDDYDIAIARSMYHGCDVWLNNPLRPQEACGTSGMKAALNGQLNLSILDGWWDECYDGENGWAISSAEYVDDDDDRRDELEANSLFDLLEREVVPRYYDLQEGRVPRRWVRRVKHTLAGLGPFVTASRMVQDYTTALYEPAAAQADRMSADGHVRAKAIAQWKRRVLADWHGVHVDAVESDAATTDIGGTRVVDAVVSLGALDGDDVEVQLVHGLVGQGDELESPAIVAMDAMERTDDLHARYRGEFQCEDAGRYGFTVRIVPSHEDLAASAELGHIAWA
ncbi:MAG: alpha-glucan family phosphorylase [Acidimicrobiales bacterium]